MCNAWNHSPGCQCGWGGEGHLGRSSLPPPQSRSLSPSYRSFSAYTNPNAVCPVCNASVFFYQSPNGSRVFFDELGPPWPKHPCTDNSGRHSSAHHSFLVPEPAFQPTRVASWKTNEWQPFIYDDLYATPPPFAHCVLRGQWGNTRLVLYVVADSIDHGALIHARNVKVGEYLLSILTYPAHSQNPIVSSLRAFTSPTHPALLKRRHQKRSVVHKKASTPKPSYRESNANTEKSPAKKKPKRVVGNSTSTKPKKIVIVRQEHHELATKDRDGKQRTVPVDVKKRRTLKI